MLVREYQNEKYWFHPGKNQWYNIKTGIRATSNVCILLDRTI